MQRSVLAVLTFAVLPHFANAATYDDLINAAKMGVTSEVASMVDRGASADSTDKEGNTLLMLAARDGNDDTVAYLIKRKAKLNTRNSVGDTALALASFRGHKRSVELLLAGGA